jgi:hypothetical protein
MISSPTNRATRRTLPRHPRFLAAAAVVAVVAATVSLATASQAGAATFTAHDGTSLVAALASASGQPGPSTIDLTRGVYAPDVTLTIAGDVTIVGPSGPGLNLTGAAVAPAGASLFVVGPGAHATFVDLSVATAGTVGGDAAVDVSGALDLENSTLDANNGPNLTVEPGGTATVRNSTLSDGLGTGLVDDGSATLINSTVADNAVEGIDDSVGTLSLVNTIVAGNGSPDCSGPASASDHSLDSDGTCGVGALSRANAALGPLRGSNGGPTPTQALEAGSAAIGAGDESKCPADDQRHYARTGHCDIGAYQAGAEAPGGPPAGAGSGAGTATSPTAGSPRPGAGAGSGAAGRPPAAGVSGHGSLRGPKHARVVFAVHALVAKPHGSLTYHDVSGRVWLKSSSLESVRIDKARGIATIKGTGTELVRRRRVSFTAVVTDHAGVRSVQVRLSSGYAGGGRLISGALALTGAGA